MAVLVGFEEDRAVLWKVFSHMVKLEKTLNLNGAKRDPKALYSFYESIINALRPTLKEGIRSIILVSPTRTNYAQEFLKHVQGHHAWLMQGPSMAVFSELTGCATTLSEVASLAKAPSFREIIGETAAEETENLIDLLEKRLYSSTQNALVLYSFEEIEDLILSSWKVGKPMPEYLMLTDTYLSAERRKGRLQRLTQIASNKGVKTKVVKADSVAGKRLSQLGGIVCIMKPN